MNKVLRVLLLSALVLAMVMPMAVSAENPYMTVSGKIFNGTNGGPETSVMVSLWRDTGGGDVMIREGSTKSAMGDFLFQVNCVQGYYTLKIDAFMEGGADAVGMGWYVEYPGEAKKLVKKEAGDPGPWTYSWYMDCGSFNGNGYDVWANLVFEYSSVAGPRFNAGWMYVSGKVFDASVANMKAGVEGVKVMVCRPAYDETTNTISVDPSNLPGTTKMCRATYTGDRGFWGMGLSREPGMYIVWLVKPSGYNFASSHALSFQVFDVYSSGGAGEAYGPGSAWLPWNFLQADWIYSNLNFAVVQKPA